MANTEVSPELKKTMNRPYFASQEVVPFMDGTVAVNSREQAMLELLLQKPKEADSYKPIRISEMRMAVREAVDATRNEDKPVDHRSLMAVTSNGLIRLKAKIEPFGWGIDSGRKEPVELEEGKPRPAKTPKETLYQLVKLQKSGGSDDHDDNDGESSNTEDELERLRREQIIRDLKLASSKPPTPIPGMQLDTHTSEQLRHAAEIDKEAMNAIRSVSVQEPITGQEWANRINAALGETRIKGFNIAYLSTVIAREYGIRVRTVETKGSLRYYVLR